MCSSDLAVYCLESLSSAQSDFCSWVTKVKSDKQSLSFPLARRIWASFVSFRSVFIFILYILILLLFNTFSIWRQKHGLQIFSFWWVLKLKSAHCVSTEALKPLLLATACYHSFLLGGHTQGLWKVPRYNLYCNRCDTNKGELKLIQLN